MKNILSKYWITIVFSLIGLLAGYLYWRFIGCRTGSCPITSHWYSSEIMSGLVGYLTGDSLNDFRNKKIPQKIRNRQNLLNGY